jgi:glucokinase
MLYAVGLDIGGTKIKYALVDQEGNILYESISPTESGTGKERVLNNVRKAVKEVLDFAASKKMSVKGIGIGAPGIIDEGLVTGCIGNLPDMEGMPLGKLIEDFFHMPVVVENDANVMGLAEQRFGAARGMTDVVFLTIGTGIGGAMVLNGKLYAGYRNRGAEIGHLFVKEDGRVCSCGARGCMEAEASVQALIEEYKTLLSQNKKDIPPQPDGKYIVAEYLKNEDEAETAMNHHFKYLSYGIAGLINVFSPQKVVIGGGISEAGDFYVNQIRERALARAMKETSQHTAIELAQLGNKAGFLGAAALVFDI